MNSRSAFLLLRFVLGLILVSSPVIGGAGPAYANGVCYVNAGVVGGGNDGTSWGDAYTDLQSALGGSPCTEVWVAAGAYKPTPGTDRTASFVLKSGVAIYGGFAGGETLLSQRDPAANPTILSGEIGVAGNSDNSYHVVVGSGTDSSALLDGFTIMAGKADGTWPDSAGGGMYSNAGDPSLVNLIFSGNSAAQFGGGMYNADSNPSLANVTFSGNSATYGGGMDNDSSSPTLENVTFSSNSAGRGGGGMSTGGSPSLTNVTFNNNLAYYGGGMCTYNGSPNLTNVTFSDNSVERDGGGMFNSFDGNPRLANVTFSGNYAEDSGGGMFNSGGSPIITNSILYGDGGGEIVDYQGSSTTVSYSIVQGGHWGTGNLHANPLLGPLQDNGGFTKTRALGFGSPAIDTGTNAGCPLEDQRGVARPQGPRCDMGAYEYPQGKLSLLSAGAQDGWILESTEISGVGGTMNAGGETFSVGDYALDKQYRSILSFNTSGLPDNAVITKATLKIKGQRIVGTNPFNTHMGLKVDIRKPYFGPAAGLAISDFQAGASKLAVATFKKVPTAGAWYSAVLSSTAYPYINLTGLTQFRLRFAKDDNDNMSADYLKFFSGNAAAAYRPVLVVEYAVP